MWLLTITLCHSLSLPPCFPAPPPLPPPLPPAQLTFPGVDGKRKGGPPQRVIQIAYLDDRVRVARFVPPEDEEGAEPSFYVFRRLVDEEEQEEVRLAACLPAC